MDMENLNRRSERPLSAKRDEKMTDLRLVAPKLPVLQAGLHSGAPMLREPQVLQAQQRRHRSLFKVRLRPLFF